MSGVARVGNKGWPIRLRFGNGQRSRFYLPRQLSQSVAEQRETRLGIMATMLSRARVSESFEGRQDALMLLKRASEQVSEDDFSSVEEVARELCADVEADKARPRPAKHQVTFREVAEMWLSGELHKRWPDVVRKPEGVRTTSKYRAALRLIYRELGTIPVASITLDDAERAKAAVPEGKSTRWYYSMLIRRVMALAEYPLRLIDKSPIPKKFVPSIGKSSEFSFLYPDEDLMLLRCEKLSKQERLLYGLLAREGFRISEALGLRWRDIDAARGVVKLDKNKTRSPRAWALSPGVTEALLAHRSDSALDDDRIFALECSLKSASRFREALAQAGIKRAELFARTAERRPIRIHDLRGTFVTISLANGRTEAWVMDRTGHTTSAMLGRYRRSARHASEIGLGPLTRLDVALGMAVPPQVTQHADISRLVAELGQASSKADLPRLRSLAHQLVGALG